MEEQNICIKTLKKKKKVEGHFIDKSELTRKEIIFFLFF
jgi:hypothetical protein